MNIRYLSSTRQSMQRLGFCKAIILEDVQSRSGVELTKNLTTLLNFPIRLSPTEEIIECLNSMPNGDKIENEDENDVTTYLQYYYICNHPSRSGWLSRLGFKEYAEGLPRYLGLLDDSYRLTEIGLVLRNGLLQIEEKTAFQNVSFTTNPLILSISQKVFFLFTIVSIDGDFLIPFVNTLSNKYGSRSFSYLDAGNRTPDILRTMLQRFTGTGYTKDDRKQIKDIRSAIEKIDNAIGENLEKLGSGSRREQTTIPRLEWLIDLGFIEKFNSPESSRSYILTEMGHRFARIFYDEYENLGKKKFIDEVIATILDENYYTLIDLVYNNRKKEIDNTNIIRYVLPAYTKLKGVSGYCAVRPLLLLTNSLRIEENQPIIDYIEVKNLIEQSYRKNPDNIYYTTTRDGTDIQLILN